MPKTNFFQGLETLQLKGTIQIALLFSSNQVWSGTIFVTPDGITDPAVKKIPPLSFKGTSAELGEGFFDLIKAPMESTSKLLANVQDYEAGLRAAEKASKMNQAKAGATAKPEPKVDTKYQDKMKKVAELEAKGKFGEAIGALPKETEFPEKKDEIAAKLKELKAKRNGFDLFDTPTNQPGPIGDTIPEPDEQDPQDLEPDEHDSETNPESTIQE